METAELEHVDLSNEPIVQKARAMRLALNNCDADAAEITLAEMCEINPDLKDELLFPVMIFLFRGQVREALQFINSFPDDRSPELKTLCLFLLGDPTWQGLAEAQAASGNPAISASMKQLLANAAVA